jgi:hypothetical protein
MNVNEQFLEEKQKINIFFFKKKTSIPTGDFVRFGMTANL